MSANISSDQHCNGVFMHLSWSPNRLTNVLESCDNQGLLSNNAWKNTLYKYQRCDDVVEVEHMRHSHPLEEIWGLKWAL